MTNRRQFIQSSVVVSALTLAEMNFLQSAFAMNEEVELPLIENFIFDNRFKEAVHLSKLASQQNIPVAEFAGDLTDLWCTQLSIQWKKFPMTLAGVTDQSGLFILETLAADHGMKLVHRTEIAAYQEPNLKVKQTIYSWLIAPRLSAMTKT